MNRKVQTLASYFTKQNKNPGLVNIVPIDEHYEPVKHIHSHDFFQVIFIDQGTADHTIEYEEARSMPSRSVSVVFPGQLHRIAVKPETRGLIIMFDETLFCSDILKNELKSYSKNLYDKLNKIRRKQVNYTRLKKMAAEITYLFRNMTPIKKEQLRFNVKILLLELIENVHENVKPATNLPLVNQFAKYKELIDLQYMETKTVAGYAAQMGISSRRLNQICKEEAGITALMVIHERLMIEIRRLLFFSGDSMKEIAYKMGFSSTPAFNRFVYMHTGQKPTALKYMMEQKDKQKD